VIPIQYQTPSMIPLVSLPQTCPRWHDMPFVRRESKTLERIVYLHEAVSIPKLSGASARLLFDWPQTVEGVPARVQHHNQNVRVGVIRFCRRATAVVSLAYGLSIYSEDSSQGS
jgi:hypothetical protein